MLAYVCKEFGVHVSSLELRRVCETGLLLLAGTVPAAEVLVSFSYQLIKFLDLP